MPDTGSIGWCGDGGPASRARLAKPLDVVALPNGGYLVADTGNDVIRRVGADGRIFTIVGTGRTGYSGDGGPALSASLAAPSAVAVTRDGSLLIADTGHDVVRRVTPDGIIERFAGTGATGTAGDGGPADAAEFDRPRGLAVTPTGAVLVADEGNNRVRRIEPDGAIDTVAGTGVAGDAGDGGPGTAAELDHPSQVASEPDGGFVIADRGNERIRRVGPTGIITTIAGGGSGAQGPTGPADEINLDFPTGVATTPAGAVLVTQAGRISALSPTGVLTSVAGTGTRGFSGDTGTPLGVQLDLPAAAAPLPDGSLLAADTENNKIVAFSTSTARKVAGSGRGKRHVPGRYVPRWNVLRITSPRNENAGDQFELRFRTSRAGWFRGKATPVPARGSAQAVAAQIQATKLHCKGRRSPVGRRLACRGGHLIEGYYRVTLRGKHGSDKKWAHPVRIHAT